MSPINYDPNVKGKPDVHLEIPEQDIKKPEKLDFNSAPEKQSENDMNAEKEKEASKAEKRERKRERKLAKAARRVMRERVGCCRKRCTWVVILGVAVIVTAGILGIFAIKQHFKAMHKEVFKHQSIINGREYPELVEVDYDKELITIRNSRSGVVFPADIVSDFKQLMVAYRDLSSNTCFIDKITKPFDKTLKELTKKKKVKPEDARRVIPSRQPIEEGLLRRFAGPHIENLCRGIPAFWIVDVKHDVIPLEIAPKPAPVPVPPIKPDPKPEPDM